MPTPIERIEEHISVLNDEVGALQVDVGGIRVDIAWLKRATLWMFGLIGSSVVGAVCWVLFQ